MSIFDDCDMCVGECEKCEKASVPYKVGQLDGAEISKKATLIMVEEKFHKAFINKLETVMDMQDTMHEWLPIHVIQFADEVLEDVCKQIKELR